MISWSSVLALVCSLNAYSSAANCGNLQIDINGRCCDLCPPGKYMKEFCSEQQQTVCVPCQEQQYIDNYHIFDRCIECRMCQSAYDENCTATTDARCSCHPGFRCSNHLCSECEKERKWEAGDKPKRTAYDANCTATTDARCSCSPGFRCSNHLCSKCEKERKCEAGDKLKRTGLKVYSYTCEPACPNDTYLDTLENICKPLTQCSLIGLPELFPGNKTHNSLCHTSGTHSNGTWIHFSFGFTLLVFLCYVCNIYRMHRAKSKHPEEMLAAKTCELQLSREESCIQVLLDENKDSIS
ncbi:tumor necrosis factor receptor superfamily member 18 isoform X3 [Genypterus blacodes]|uniref:tumor necrosis factor receptor superfamily member 18 isoform X3 n=1 Tax=Genypterus blacodes TaxID=154954 RepID=UPI003F7597B8